MTASNRKIVAARALLQAHRDLERQREALRIQESDYDHAEDEFLLSAGEGSGPCVHIMGSTALVFDWDYGDTQRGRRVSFYECDVDQGTGP